MLDSYGIRAVQYAFRWSLCFMLREFPFKDCIILWDALISEPQQQGFSGFIQYVAASYMLQFAGIIRTMSPESILVFLNNLPIGWDEGGMQSLISDARRLQRLHKNFLEKREMFIKKIILSQKQDQGPIQPVPTHLPGQSSLSMPPQQPSQFTSSSPSLPSYSSSSSGNTGNVAGLATSGISTTGGSGSGTANSMYQSAGNYVTSYETLTSPGLSEEKNDNIFASPKMVTADELHSSMSAVRAVIPVPTYSSYNDGQFERAPEKRRTIDLLKWVMN